MAISAQVSLWGIYQLDSTILDGLTLPDGMDSENVKNNLLLETASMEILYPNAPFLKAAITVWAAERKGVWDRLYATTQLEYNPIENYDRMEEGESETSGNSSGENNAVNSNTSYDSNEFKDTAKAISGGSNEFSNSGRFSSRTHGNIGVTTSQQMIEAEREVSKFCMTKFIIDDFISRFCVCVY